MFSSCLLLLLIWVLSNKCQIWSKILKHKTKIITGWINLHSLFFFFLFFSFFYFELHDYFPSLYEFLKFYNCLSCMSYHVVNMILCALQKISIHIMSHPNSRSWNRAHGVGLKMDDIIMLFWMIDLSYYYLNIWFAMMVSPNFWSWIVFSGPHLYSFFM